MRGPWDATQKRSFISALNQVVSPIIATDHIWFQLQYCNALKKELDKQVELGILEKVYKTEWGMPMMVVPKKDNTIHTVDDLHELNKCIDRKQYL